MKILIVDDSKIQRDLMKNILLNVGYSCITATTGNDCLNKYKENNPDMILLDIVLPDIPGYEVARQIRETSKNNQQNLRWIPIIFVSGLCDEAYLEKCILCGGDDYIYKPINEIPLKAKIYAMERLVDLKNKSIEQNSELQRKEKLESLQKLSFGVAHEIRNPLAAIVQSSQNLIRRLEPNLESNKSIAEELGIDMEMIQNYIKEREIINFAENILESSKRVSIIVDGLLKISQSSESEHKYTNIKQIIDSAIDLAQHVNLSFQLPFNKITIISEYPDIIPEICCCSNEIEQVIYSILNNASYALVNIPRLPTITIKVTVIDNDIDINIIDNGHGISSNHANKIFDPFFTTKNLGQGLGLGLTVAHNIITNKHHGKISVDSKENEGTIVTIKLPIHKSMDNNSIT